MLRRLHCQTMPWSFLFLLVSCFASPYYACNQLDRHSLLSLSLNMYFSLNWSSINCCLWEGIDCDSNGRVTHLLLPRRSLNGRLSPFLRNLTRLSHLNLSHNGLSGPLPTRLFQSLNSLQVLDLSFNSLSGEFPLSLSLSIQIIDLSSNNFNGRIQSSFLQQAPNLIHFNFSHNTFTGPIPLSVCINSCLIKFLDFSSNEFSGQIPNGLGGYSKLEVFRAGFNLLSGPLPYDIYKAKALREISLPSNQLMGPIDNGVVHLSNLTILELSYNELISGELPQDIGKLSNMEKLLLDDNSLSGSLPPSIMSCTNLIVLNLRDNLLQGDISTLNFSKLQRLRTLDFGYNNFSGNLPETLYLCKSLAAIRFNGNKLGGQILPQILALQSLSFLSLSANRLTNITGAIRILNGCKSIKFLFLSMNFIGETMPDDDNTVALDGFQNLEVLCLRQCHLTGEVPPWLAKLRKLEYLDLSLNQLIGPVPGWLGSLPSLFYIDLSHNQISGEFPQELSKLPALTSEDAAAQVDGTYLELPIFTQPTNATSLMYNRLSSIPPSIILLNNSLRGRIPVEIGQLQFLHVLDLSYNNFSGNIPDQISKLTNLEKLNLSRNHLSGEIPTSLGSLHFLSSFNVSNNDLQGPIPPGTQLQSFPASAYMGNPELCGLPLPNNCEPITDDNEHENVQLYDEHETLLFHLTVGFGYGTGFLLVCITFLFHILERCLLRVLRRGEEHGLRDKSIQYSKIQEEALKLDADRI